MFIGTIDFCHFIRLSLTLTLPWGHKVSAKQNLLASFSRILFIWSGWNLILWWSNSSWTFWDCFFFFFFFFFSKIIETRGINAVWLTTWKKKPLSLACIWTFMKQFDSNLVWCTLHSDISLIDLVFGSWSQKCEKAQGLRQLSHKTCDWFEWDLVYCWGLLV